MSIKRTWGEKEVETENFLNSVWGGISLNLKKNIRRKY